MSRPSRLSERGLRRTNVLGLAALLLVVCLAGCAGSAATPTPTPTPSPSPTATPSPTPSPSPSPSPTITVGYSQTATGIVYVATDGTTLNVPEIPGLTASLADGKVSYAALGSNPYGLTADAIGGYFSPLVSVGGKQVGGVALEAHVAAKYLQDTADVAGIPPVLVPVDFRSATSAVSIDADTLQGYDYLRVSGGSVRVNDILPGTRQFIYNHNPTYGTGVLDENFPTSGGDKWTPLYFFCVGCAPGPAKPSLGQEVGEATGQVSVFYGLNNHTQQLELSNLLTIGKSPVSVFLQGS